MLQFVCLYAYMYVCTMCVCMYMCACICVHVYMHVFWFRLPLNSLWSQVFPDPFVSIFQMLAGWNTTLGKMLIICKRWFVSQTSRIKILLSRYHTKWKGLKSKLNRNCSNIIYCLGKGKLYTCWDYNKENRKL